VVVAVVGEPLQLQLGLVDGEPEQFEARGGPDSLAVGRDGRIDYTPAWFEVGSWRVTVKMAGGTELLRTEAFWLEVEKDEGDDALEASMPLPTPPGSRRSTGFFDLGDPRVRPETGADFKPSPRAIAGCSIGLGVASSLSEAGSSWEFVGQDIVFRTSPAMSGDCSGGGKTMHWLIGMDSAPNVIYLGPPPRGAHILAVTGGFWVGNEQLQAGPYLTMGANLLGAGGRFVWLPIKTKYAGSHGLQLRATVFMPSAPAGELMLMYTGQTGYFKNP